MHAADNWTDRTRLVGIVCAIPVFLSWSVAASGAVLDQSQDATGSNIFIGATDQRIAQTFTPSIEGDLSEVKLQIGYLPSIGGTASDLLLEVMTTASNGAPSNGAPSSTVLGTASLAHTAFPTAGGLLDPTPTAFDFSGIPLHAGQRYALALRVTTPGSVCGPATPACTEPSYRASYHLATDAYPRGQLFSGVGPVPNFALIGDLSFQTFMIPAAAQAAPEPTTWLALLAGLAGLVATRVWPRAGATSRA